MADLTWIAVADTAVKIGLGAVIGATGAFWLEVYRRRQDRAREYEQRRREHLEKPVVSFVDEMLTLISRAYWNRADGKDPDITASLEAFREKEAVVEARVMALNDEALADAFHAVDSAMVNFRTELGEGSLARARDRMKEAQARAGDLLRLLYGNPRRHSV